jgi:nitrate/nitrite transport system substrate-binding protein
MMLKQLKNAGVTLGKRSLPLLGILGTLLLGSNVATAATAEKTELKLGFIKLTDMAPLAVALEEGYFEDEGLFVELEAQANWKVLLDRVIDGQLDGAHMLTGQALAATVGIGTKAALQTAFVMDLNGNACTVSNNVWQQLQEKLPKDASGKVQFPLNAKTLQPVLNTFAEKGKKLQLAMVFPFSSHNYELRYWLAAGGIHPGFYAPDKGDNSGQLDAQVLISVTPPPQMPATLEAGTIDGYCVGEPWNQQAVARGLGVPVVTNEDIHRHMAEKIFGVSKSWADKNPNTHLKLVKALIRAGHWLDQNNNQNRAAAAKLISQPFYVGADEKIIANSMTGIFEYSKGDVRKAPDFNVFFRYHATYPYYSDAIWYLSQMRRWGQISSAQTDDWYLQTAKQVFQPAIYQQAATELIQEQKLTAADFPDFSVETGLRAADAMPFIDGIVFDGRTPNQYLRQFALGKKD